MGSTMVCAGRSGEQCRRSRRRLPFAVVSALIGREMTSRQIASVSGIVCSPRRRARCFHIGFGQLRIVSMPWSFSQAFNSSRRRERMT